ncbi:putative P-loop containing nucleoside triphosphate hydrolase, leucine-rich repeat domain superfamily [Helianthus annuus]|nr:putative P-loop containing nucleoside triphosphate hydrolase, leucine-rich repeat domain superfamily [Helianthus annuus]
MRSIQTLNLTIILSATCIHSTSNLTRTFNPLLKLSFPNSIIPEIKIEKLKMAYAGIQMFMEKLNQLINCNHIPFFNNPTIICERPQFQRLYEELGSMIQTLFIDQHQDLHDLEKLKDLKRRFMDAAEMAHYMVDLFLSAVHVRKNGNLPTSEDFNPSLNLDRISLKFIKVEFKSMRIDGMKLDSSPRPQSTLNQSAAAQSSFSRGSKKLLDEIFVGIDRDVEHIRDKLVEDQKKLDVVSIVGMGGLGKTALATKVFNDAYVKHHFHVRVWVTVSQTYDKRGVLTQILESIRGQLHLEKANDSRLRELVHKNLMGKRYLIVIDDIWHIQTWDNLKVFFPHDNTGSRILLTSRQTEVAMHANSDGLIHHLGYLNKEKGWELLCQKVFQGRDCPEWSIKVGMQIVETCQGLPLALVVIAGVLAKHAWGKKFWKEIAERTSSYIVGGQNGCLETLGLSYSHLPEHLRECFLYLGGFPEDYMFQVERLIWLWVAEGFIQKDGNRSLEDIAEGYLMDLIDRNLVIVADRSKSNGGVKACKVHDLIRELCLEKAKEEGFILETEKLILSPQFSNGITPTYKLVRVFINEESINPYFPYPTTQNLRTILCFLNIKYSGNAIVNGSFVLLRVLDLQNCRRIQFSEDMKLLVHLRHLAIRIKSEGFPSSICNLWNLQTLIYITAYRRSVVLPGNISDLVNLRHLLGHKNNVFVFPLIEKPMNLQTISSLELGNGVGDCLKCFPYIKKLRCHTYLETEYDFKSLNYLVKLKLIGNFETSVDRITFPTSLKTLTLERCGLPWSEMSIIQSLPNLQVLKLHSWAFNGSCWNTDGQEFPQLIKVLEYNAIEGSCWDTDGQKFQQLKFLRLEGLDLKTWNAYSASFPCLKQLEIIGCHILEEIPFEIGDIPTLELIQIRGCRKCVDESARRIEEEQHDFGNYNLKIHII